MKLTELNHEINSRDMSQVGNWNMIKVVTDKTASHNPCVRLEEHTESIDKSTRARTMWQHKDGKTVLTVSKHHNGTFDTKWKVVVYMGSDDTVGTGWTCGINAYCDSPKDAVDYAYTYMKENDDMSRLYD